MRSERRKEVEEEDEAKKMNIRNWLPRNPCANPKYFLSSETKDEPGSVLGTSIAGLKHASLESEIMDEMKAHDSTM